MQLKELQLLAYGPFTDCTLRLRPGLNVVYGPNEAGKSSALRAVLALLFGVNERTADNFVHSYPQLRVGGVLVDAQGQRLACVRRKGRKATLRDGQDDQPVPETLLRDMLGSVNEEFFTSAFGIDHIRLREGGEEVVRGEGRVGELLFAAGGVAHLRDKQRTLEELASSLFKRGGQKPRINQALAEFKQLDSEIRALQQSPEAWAQHDAEYNRLERHTQHLGRELEQADAMRSRLSRIQAALPLLGTWKEKQAELATLAQVVALPSDTENRFGKANEQRNLAEARIQQAQQRIAKLQQQLQEVEVPQQLLAEAHRIDALYRRLGSHEKASEDRQGLVGQARAAQNAAQRTIQKLGWSLTLDQAAQQRLPDQRKARVRALASRSGEVQQAVEQQQKLRDRLCQQRAELETQLSRNTPGEDSQISTAPPGTPPEVSSGREELQHQTVLERAVHEALLVSESQDRLPALHAEVHRLERESADMLARLPQWDGTLAALCRLTVPTIETVEQFDTTGKKIASQLDHLATAEERIESDRGQCREELAILELAHTVPTEEELLVSREIRNRGLRLAVQSLRGEHVSPAELDRFVQEVAEGTDLATNLEPSARRADSIADRLRREADRVAEKSQLLGRSQALAAQADKVSQQLAAAQAARAAWESDWQHCWDETGISPATPSEMRGWLRNFQELLAVAGKLAEATAARDQAEQRCESACQSLTGALVHCGVRLPEAANLRQRIHLGQQFIETRAEAHRLNKQQAENLRHIHDELQQAEQGMCLAQEELQQWKTDWAAAMQPLNLSADALPEQAESVLVNLEELFRHLDQADGFHQRINEIDQAAEEFTQAARALAAEVAPSLSAASVEEIAAGLNQKLAEARRITNKQETLREQLAEEQQTVHAAESSRAEGQAIIEALAQQAGCQALHDLPAAMEKSHRKHQLEADVEELQSQLAPFCGGRCLDEFIREAESEDTDTLPTRLEELGHRIATLREQRDGALVDQQREASKLEQFRGASAAADKATERQFVLAQLAADAREYAVATVASRLLQRAIERYQERAQGPVLSKACEHFRNLTCQAFSGLRADYDESGQEVLVGVRPDGTTLRVEAMSEGARDQLYLALRLGTLDQWLDQHEPIPFLVDDVLLTFDDNRATAAIEALLALARRTQVLFFTHHEHLVALMHRTAAAHDSTVHVLADWC